ncbi:hypothetical protein IAD21_00207 [Abditibacteriota bacterium]|nr:hypothetical protein IAD21_00207 [Abditibacteriota bacterium]
MSEAGDIRLVALRRKNAKVPLPPERGALCHTVRQQVESAFRVISQTLPHKIHAVAPQGFLLKLNALIIAYAFACFAK